MHYYRGCCAHTPPSEWLSLFHSESCNEWLEVLVISVLSEVFVRLSKGIQPVLHPSHPDAPRPLCINKHLHSWNLNKPTARSHVCFPACLHAGLFLLLLLCFFLISTRNRLKGCHTSAVSFHTMNLSRLFFQIKLSLTNRIAAFGNKSQHVKNSKFRFLQRARCVKASSRGSFTRPSTSRVSEHYDTLDAG